MKDRRRRLKSHIRAAKEWLGQAENSLNKEDDLAGDLKLMLAKAELKRAEETDAPPFWRTVLLKAAPFFAAVFTAVIIWSVNSEPAAKENIPSEIEAAAEEKPQPISIAEEKAPAISTPAVMPAAEAAVPESQPSYERPAAAAQPLPESAPAPAVTEPAETTQTVVEAPKVPDEDMQKLMQSAGKVLRSK